MSPQSNFGPAAKPIVLLINEQSLSDAESGGTGARAWAYGNLDWNTANRDNWDVTNT